MARPSTLAVEARWLGRYRCRVRARQFIVEVDEPAESGGDDAGPQPTELFLGSLASCFALAVGHVAAKRSIELVAVDVTAVGRYDGPRFDAIRLEVRVDPVDPETDVDLLLGRARAVCYVSNTLALGPDLEVVRVDAER
ncbi:MAG: OsmC family protein [Acidimicrobiales bacterium]